MIHLINALVTLALVSMMVSMGLRVDTRAIVDAARSRPLVVRTILANYVLFPVVVVVLLGLFRAKPMVAAGFLTLAVCPGAPFGPPFTSLAKGNVAVSIGLMLILAGSSVFVAPVLLRVLLPHLAGGAAPPVRVVRIASTLLVSQLVPLAAGLLMRKRWPALAARAQKPMDLATKALGLLAIALIFVAQFRTLAEIRLRGLAGMLTLWGASLALGWLAGDDRGGCRLAAMETTSLRNVAVAMVIASTTFPNTSALSAVVAYGVVSTLGSLAVAVVLGRRAARRTTPGLGTRTPPVAT